MKNFLCAALLTRTKLAQKTPIEDAVVVPVLPENGDAIRAGRNYVFQAGLFCVDNGELENAGVGRPAHIIMPAAAFGTGAGSAQEGERIGADVTVIPSEGEFCF